MPATDPFAIDGRVALVTGASSGLGKHFATLLAGHGAKVALAARRTERLRTLANEIEAAGGRALPVQLDVTDADTVRAAVDAVEQELGAITILVNNSGVADAIPVLELQEADWDRVVDTNLKGAWLVAQEVARHMVRLGHGGSIINIASIVGLRATGTLAAYGASKAGLVHLTHLMALELARHAIRVNAICPGYIETDINREFLQGERGQAMMRRVPQRRFGKPGDLDGLLLLLASDASDYMTGSVITADGGHSLGLP
jgi:NAD(P)-dependent dehydrogenase (short-subunit alcohol dehydrogenase family)